MQFSRQLIARESDIEDVPESELGKVDAQNTDAVLGRKISSNKIEKCEYHVAHWGTVAKLEKCEVPRGTCRDSASEVNKYLLFGTLIKEGLTKSGSPTIYTVCTF